jgi:hypothetical protein
MLAHAEQRYTQAIDQLCERYSISRAAVQPLRSWRRPPAGADAAARQRLRGQMEGLQDELLQLLPQLPQPLPAALDPGCSLASASARVAAVVMPCRFAGARESCRGQPVAGFPGQALLMVGIGSPLPRPRPSNNLEIDSTPAHCCACSYWSRHTHRVGEATGVLPAAYRLACWQRVLEMRCLFCWSEHLCMLSLLLCRCPRLRAPCGRCPAPLAAASSS